LENIRERGSGLLPGTFQEVDSYMNEEKKHLREDDESFFIRRLAHLVEQTSNSEQRPQKLWWAFLGKTDGR